MTKTAKKVLSGTLWMARGTATMLGFAVMLAIVLGVGTTALAAVPGDPFELGQTNTIDNALTKLTGSNAGTMLTVDNNSSASGARALDLRVEAGKQPLNVNAEAGKAGNLNADEVDGLGADRIGVNGLEQVVSFSDTNSESSKRISAVCPDGKVVVGAGYSISGGESGSFPDDETDVVVDSLLPSELFVTAIAREEEPTSASWAVGARAICATAP